MKIKFEIVKHCYGSYLFHFKEANLHMNSKDSYFSFVSAYIYGCGLTLLKRIEVVDENGGTKFFNRMRKWA